LTKSSVVGVAEGEAAAGDAGDFDGAGGDICAGAGVWANVFAVKKMPINVNRNTPRLETQFRDWAKISNPNVEIRNKRNRNH